MRTSPKLVVAVSAVAAGLVVLVAAATVGKELWYRRLERAENAAARDEKGNPAIRGRAGVAAEIPRLGTVRPILVRKV